MRTTIELKDEQRAELVRLAAMRSQKGFSLLVQEAIDFYLKHRAGAGDAAQKAALAFGSINTREAAAMRREIQRLRSKWR